MKQVFRASTSSAIINLASSYSSRLAAKQDSNELTEDDAFFYTSTKLPARIQMQQTVKLFHSIKNATILKHKNLLKAQGWQFFAVKQNRGTCYYLDRRITIPVWAIERGIDYLEWYLSHEIAHAFAGHKAKHGEYFMEWLKVICPSDSIHYETGYKPRNATMQGISKDRAINTLTDADFL